MNSSSFFSRIRSILTREQMPQHKKRQHQMRLMKLEDRRVLNASLALTATELTLSDFDAGDVAADGLNIFEGDVSIDGANVDAYIFELDANTWDSVLGEPGDPADLTDGVEINGTQLRIAKSIFDGSRAATGVDIVINDSLNVDLDVRLDTSLETFGGDFQATIGGSFISNAGFLGTTSNEFGEASGDVSVTAVGDITFMGNIDTSGLNNDVDSAESNGGNITLNSDDGNITTASIRAEGGITADPATTGEGGLITISANDADASGDDGDVIIAGTIETSSETGATNVDIDASRNLTVNENITSNGGSVDLNADSNDNESGAIAQSGGTITAESLSLSAATGIGASSAIQTAADNLQFNNTTNSTNISNTGALVIDGASSFGSGGGELAAGSPLTINAAILSGADFILEATGDGGANTDVDDLTINASITHTGLAGVAKAITLRADDDVNFASGVVSFANTNAGDTLTVRADSSAVPTPDANLTGDILFTGGTVNVGPGTANFSTNLAVGGGAIVGNGADATAEIVAATIDLNAATGIGAGGILEITAASVSADSTNGNIDIDSLATGTVTAASVTTGTGSIQFDQTGNQILNVTNAATTDGAIAITNAGANLNANSVSAGGVANNVTLTNTAAGNVTVGAGGIATAGGLVDIDAVDDVSIEGAITSEGGNVDIDAANGAISSNATGDINTTGDEIDEDSGDVTMDAATSVTLLGDITTDGFNNAASILDSDAGDVMINAADGNITTANISAIGGTTNDPNTMGEGGSITLNAQDGDASADDGDVITNGTLNTSTEIGATKVDIDAVRDIDINQAVITRGANVDIDAGRDISSAANGDITTTGNTANEAGGTVDIDAGRIVNLAGDIDTRGNASNGAGGNVNVDTVDGDITVAAIDARAAGTGIGGNISLNANDSDNDNVTATGDVTNNGIVQTNNNATITVEADDSVNINANVTAGGTGAVMVTANADIATDTNTTDGSTEAITMAGGTIIDAGSGTITLTNDDDNGLGNEDNSGNITAQNLTTTNNTAAAIVVNSDNDALLQGTVTTGGGNVNVDADRDIRNTGAIDSNGGIVDFLAGRDALIQAAVTTDGGSFTANAVRDVTSTAAGDITTTGDTANEAGGIVNIDAGRNVNLAGDIDTRGSVSNGAGGNVNVDTVDGDITVAAIDARAAGTGIGGNIFLNANDSDNDNVTATGDVTNNGIVQTNNNATITFEADDSVNINANVTAGGTGAVMVTANADIATDTNTTDGSTEAITMAGGTIINAGSGTITLTNDDDNGLGDEDNSGNITAQTLTTTNNTAAAIVVNSDNDALLQGTVTTGGGNVNVDADRDIRNTGAIDSNGGIVDFLAGRDALIQAAVTTDGGSFTANAVRDVTSTAAGDITTTGDTANEAGGIVDIDAGRNVNLAGDIDTRGSVSNGAGGNVNVDTVDGDITVAAIDARAAGTGIGGNIFLNANDSDNDNVTATGDVTNNGIVQTNNNATITVEADDSVNINANVTTGGTGAVLVTANADIATDTNTTDGSTEAITMAGGTIIDAGSGTITLTNDDDNGLGDEDNSGNITAQTLTTTNNTAAAIVVNSDNDALLQGTVTTGGGGIDIDADRDIVTAAGGDITTIGNEANEDSGDVTMDAGRNINLSGFVDTSGFDNPGSLADSAGGDIALTTVNGNITTNSGATLDARGGDNNDADALPNAEGGSITLTANDAAATNNVGDITIGDAINTSAQGAAPIRVRLLAEEDVAINAVINTNGASVDIDATTGAMNTNAAGDINTTADESNEDSGDVTIDAATGVTLLGDITTDGFNNAASILDSDAGDVVVNSADGNITTANISAVGGATTDPIVMGEGGSITLNAQDGDASTDDADVIINGTLNTSTEVGATNIDIDAARDVDINQSITTLGASVDIDAGRDVTSAVASDLHTVGEKTSEDGGDVFIDAGRRILVTDMNASGSSVAGGPGGNAGTISLNSGTVVPGATVTLNGDITAAGGSPTGNARGNGSNFVIDDPTLIGVDADAVPPAPSRPEFEITSDIVINTTGATSGNVAFMQTVDGVTAFANDLTIIAGSTEAPATTTFGNVDFDSNVGAGTALGDVTVDSANNLDFNGTVTATSLNQLSGVGTTTLDGVVIANPGGPTSIHTFDAGSAINAVADTITMTGHGLETGDTVIYDNGAGGTVNGGSLIPPVISVPGLATDATYVVIRIDANTIQLATSQENAEADTAIDLTGIGTGTDHSIAKAAVSLTTAGTIDVNADIIAEDSPVDATSATGEQIALTANNIDLAADIDITTASIQPTATNNAYTPTGDKIRIVADNNLIVGAGAEIITDGGVANTFEPDLPVGAIGAVLGSGNFPVGADAFFLRTYTVTLGNTGEVNLQVHVDWRDPSNDGIPVVVPGSFNTPTSDRYQTFSVGAGGNSLNVSHLYSNLNDFIPFNDASQPIFFADFSLSHHDSIRVSASNTIDNASGSIVQSSSDDPNTGSFNPLAQANIAPSDSNFPTAGVNPRILDAAQDNIDLSFDDGLFEVRVETVLPFFPQQESPPPTPEPAPIAAAPQVDTPPLFVNAVVPVEDVLTSFSTQSEDYFQLRKVGDAGEPVPGFERIDDAIGWKLLQPQRLKQWVSEAELPSDDGYELWLITTKARDGEDVTFERPVLKFDIFRDQPFPMEEELLDDMPDLNLERLDINDLDDIIDPEVPAENVEGETSGIEIQIPEDPAIVIPEDEAITQTDSPHRTVSAAMATLAVSSFQKKQRPKVSENSSLVSRLLDRLAQK